MSLISLHLPSLLLAAAAVAATTMSSAPALRAQDPAATGTLHEAIFYAQREELRARSEHQTTEGFQAWRVEFAARMGTLLERWETQPLAGEDLFDLARLAAYALAWPKVDEFLTRYLAGTAAQASVARAERIRARAQSGRMDGARADLRIMLEKEPRRVDLALFLYALPALVEPEGRALGLQVVEHLTKRYEGDAYAPICASFSHHFEALGKPYAVPKALASSATKQLATAGWQLYFYFRTSVPITRAPLPFLKQLQQRFESRGLKISIAAPQEGKLFWDRFRPPGEQPTPEQELQSLQALCRALELPFECAVLDVPSVIERDLHMHVLPHFVLVDPSGVARLFACGGEGYEWLTNALDLLLPQPKEAGEAKKQGGGGEPR